MNEFRKLIGRSSELFGLYSSLDVELFGGLSRFLDTGAEVYKSLGESVRENQFISFKCEVVSVERGFNPLTFEAVGARRRELRRVVALHVLQESAKLLRGDVVSALEKLEYAETELRPIVLLAIQRGIVTSESDWFSDADKFKALWRTLFSVSETQGPMRNLSMQFNILDLQIVFSDLVEAAQLE